LRTYSVSKQQFTCDSGYFKPFPFFYEIFSVFEEKKDALHPRVAGGGFAASESSLALDSLHDREARPAEYY